MTGKAKSKAQRRLFGMALAVKRGTYNGTPPPHVKKMADSMTEEKLIQYAGTKQKKRRKDGSVGKRNAIPYKVDKKKKKLNEAYNLNPNYILYHHQMEVGKIVYYRPEEPVNFDNVMIHVNRLWDYFEEHGIKFSSACLLEETKSKHILADSFLITCGDMVNESFMSFIESFKEEDEHEDDDIELIYDFLRNKLMISTYELAQSFREIARTDSFPKDIDMTLLVLWKN